MACGKASGGSTLCGGCQALHDMGVRELARKQREDAQAAARARRAASGGSMQQPKGGCAVVTLALFGGIGMALAGLAYGISQWL